MSAGGRARRRQLADEAYDLQVKAGLMARRTPFEYSQRILCSAVNTSKGHQTLTTISSYRVQHSMVHSVLAQ